MEVTVGTARSRKGILVASMKLVEQNESRLVLHSKRLSAWIAAAVTGAMSSLFIYAFLHFYRQDPHEWIAHLIVGGLGVVLAGLTVMFLYFGIRRPDRIDVDAGRETVEFDRRRDSAEILFSDVSKIDLRSEDRSRRRRERCLVHPVVLVTRDGREFEIDAASNLEQMIKLAASLRQVIGLPPANDP
ncbi:MAG: hypothetical protein OES26_16955 [Gammaproteobacteria bacterium]|nr:hypothetical protein [Gammaproteobacteria bacterium]